MRVHVSGSSELTAPAATVRAALADPDVLAQALPGCSQLAPTETGGYHATITRRVGAIDATYEVHSDRLPAAPGSPTRWRVDAVGTPGRVGGEVGLQCDSAQAGGTLVGYTVDVEVTGLLEALGQQLLAGAVRRAADELFAALPESWPPAATASSTTTGTGPSTSGPVPAAPAPSVTPPAPAGLARVLAVGALGVLAGWLLGRGPARRMVRAAAARRQRKQQKGQS